MLFAPLAVQADPDLAVVGRRRLLAQTRFPSIGPGIDNLASGKANAVEQVAAILSCPDSSVVALALCRADQSSNAFVDGKFVHRPSIAAKRALAGALEKLRSEFSGDREAVASCMAIDRRVTNG